MAVRDPKEITQALDRAYEEQEQAEDDYELDAVIATLRWVLQVDDGGMTLEAFIEEYISGG